MSKTPRYALDRIKYKVSVSIILLQILSPSLDSLWALVSGLEKLPFRLF